MPSELRALSSELRGAVAAICLAISATTASAQQSESGLLGRATPPSSITRASRISQAPVLDGRDDDSAWRDAISIDDFRQAEPTENGEPAFPTSARVIYDDRFLYVFVRANDAHPDSIVGRLSRRDVNTNSD